jgi:peptide/nickel transport system substrate-binding protein
LPSSSSSTRSSCSRSELPGAARPPLAPLSLLGCALALALALAGCGGAKEGAAPTAATGSPQPEGTLRIAVGSDIATIDPLLARNRAERMAARQVYEPLVSAEAGPFGQTRTRPGLLTSIRPLDDGTIWAAKLRPGVRFGDGEPFDADAVIANARRWMSRPEGAALVPELAAVDSPRPGLVRFLLDRPEPRFDRELRDSRLAVVAPGVLASSPPAGVRVDADGGGTGPFEVRERETGRTLLARKAAWWGTRLGLGPGLDQIEFDTAHSSHARADQLREGGVEVADDLSGRSARIVAADPLLAVVAGGGSRIGMERSVRGIDSGAPDQPLADVWLTDLR